MIYRKMARVPKGVDTKWGGRAKSTLAGEAPEVEPTRVIAVTMAGTCCVCETTTDDMESEGWFTNDGFKTFYCPECWAEHLLETKLAVSPDLVDVSSGL